ncbi:hypothetical protein DFP72DRAFT_896688 [Ephemerocybe angulata]|uniref:Uncharacterized protein n=1 Tax=Ephemerocybe angulata TaxID=980116 RepID=A0A8H6I0Z5_9AGAR|nr:hypothetical protein DFP72DRAFT_896688 [Tulosesus angulatus]
MCDGPPNPTAANARGNGAKIRVCHHDELGKKLGLTRPNDDKNTLRNQRYARTNTRRRPNSSTTPFHDGRSTNERSRRSTSRIRPERRKHSASTSKTSTVNKLHSPTTEPAPCRLAGQQVHEKVEILSPRLTESNAATTETKAFVIRGDLSHKQRRLRQCQKLQQAMFDV